MTLRAKHDLNENKTFNGVDHDYYYVDGLLRHEQVGDEYEIFYEYDADGLLSFLIHVDLQTGGKAYCSVVTNAQGDVIRILGGNGAIRATYTYDAWGNITSSTDTTPALIGSKNPIRYKNFCNAGTISQCFLPRIPTQRSCWTDKGKTKNYFFKE